MKYVTPECEVAVVETEDILATSSEKYEVEQKDDGSGNVLMNVFDLFN